MASHDPVAHPGSTIAELTHKLTSFILVCIHTILYHRRLYPPATFLTTRAYDHPVAQSRHPAVCRWVRDAIAALDAQLLRPKDGAAAAGGWVERAVLVVFSDAAEVMERYVFDLAGLP
ncbi:MAG: hypothetical protein INR71_10375, partial [Terriglobus roseus]|nr:hypothetical protein [Terriglobus roseus]